MNRVDRRETGFTKSLTGGVNGRSFLPLDLSLGGSWLTRREFLRRLFTLHGILLVFYRTAVGSHELWRHEPSGKSFPIPRKLKGRTPKNLEKEILRRIGCSR